MLMTLTKGQGHNVHFIFIYKGQSVPNLNIDNISDNIQSGVMKLGHNLVYHRNIYTILMLMTLTKGQGHNVHLK